MTNPCALLVPRRRRGMRARLRPAWPALLLIALLATGCDPQRVAKLEEGVSSEVDVRRQFGDPVTVTVAPDGTRTLEYPRQPEGWTNYVITIGPDGKMSSLRQLLAEDNFARVHSGMSRQQVRDLLGRPAEQKRYDLRREEVWSWRYKPVNESRLFSVTFDADGKVLGTSTALDPREQAQGR
ncbi:MAG TPA: outer membrane protein assembly factor BamE [Rubrivivax sp.]|nr:outer membrane protein assembly factor BamE [Rubrivivax sp.]